MSSLARSLARSLDTALQQWVPPARGWKPVKPWAEIGSPFAEGLNSDVQLMNGKLAGMTVFTPEMQG